VRARRRCGIDGGPDKDRWNFTAEDDPIFPMYITKGGFQYGFCPAKARWDQRAMSLFAELSLCRDQKIMPVAGGLIDQPGWFVEMMSWFGPLYDRAKAAAFLQMVLGGKKSKGSGGSQNEDGTEAKAPEQPTKGRRQIGRRQ